MSWILQTTQWYFFILVLGVIALPITKRIFGAQFFDFGYSFSKTIGLLIVSYAALVLGVLHLLPFTRESLFLILIIVGTLNLFFVMGRWRDGGPSQSRSTGKHPAVRADWDEERQNLPITHNQIILIIFEEILFIACLFFWVIVRGQEGSIHGLEKFMDFGFINSILRSTYFPPKDMWLAGHAINYYYFGHLTGAVLTKLSGIASNYAYNLILATLFALGVTQTFSFCFNIMYKAFENKIKVSFLSGILGAFLLNLAGNLHTIYAFTTGYTGDKPVPFWNILSSFNPLKYWYPNATRFIPFTIHEFPIYSYVVADLHGHVFDIPFVLLTLAFLFRIITSSRSSPSSSSTPHSLSLLLSFVPTLFLSFLCAVHYMTNAFDGPIYLLVSMGVLLYLLGPTKKLVLHLLVIGVGFIIFTAPFSMNFIPFVSGIGVNCAPAFLVNHGKIGPFLFEKGNCQTSPLWMLLILWGFFLFHFFFFITFLIKESGKGKNSQFSISKIDHYMLILCTICTFLLIVPEFFYIKDIYPAHFRANTMFKLGYQAFMMMSIASTYVFFRLKQGLRSRNPISVLYVICFVPLFVLVAIYPTFAVNSYYGTLQKEPQLNGSIWIHTSYPAYEGIISYFNTSVIGQPTILEAQGDSYTDFNLVSAYTGIPTVGGWWVHEWLWRGSPNVIGNLIPDIQNIYEGKDLGIAQSLIKKFGVKYIVVGPNERSKYTNLDEGKLKQLGAVVYKIQDSLTASPSYVLKML